MARFEILDSTAAPLGEGPAAGDMFPKDPAMLDLGHWHEYEQVNRDAFIGMYQFWCAPRGS